jgi:hypothetical protein
MLSFLFKRKTDPVVERAECLAKWANDIRVHFELPWDGRKRLQNASDDTREEIADLYAHSVETTSYPHFPDTYWGHRLPLTAIVMEKLGYTPAEITAYKNELFCRHRGHFHPKKDPKTL